MSASTPKAASSRPDRRHRRHPRYAGEFRVAVTVLDEKHYKKLEGHCRDLSEAGMGILLAEELSVGEVVDLKFAIPGSTPWEMRGVLRYRRGYHYGFEFLSIGGDQQKTLRHYLKELKPID